MPLPVGALALAGLVYGLSTLDTRRCGIDPEPTRTSGDVAPSDYRRPPGAGIDELQYRASGQPPPGAGYDWSRATTVSGANRMSR